MATHSAVVQRFPWDALERIGWTALQGVVGLVVVELADVDMWWALPVASALAALKALIAKKVGQPGTASTLPVSKDPAAAPVRQPPVL